jgi:hypothetical protein
MQLVKDINFLHCVIIDHSDKMEHTELVIEHDDALILNEKSKAFKKLESFLDLGKPDKFDLSNLCDQEKDEFLGMLYELLKCGVVGYQKVETKGKIEKHYVINNLGDECFSI